MDKKTSSLKLKIIGTSKVPLIGFLFVLSMLSLDLSCVHTRDSSRADSIFPPASNYLFFFGGLMLRTR